MRTLQEQLKDVQRIMGTQKSGYIIKFGKHKGQDISDVPSSYLKWAVKELPDNELIDQAGLELERRSE